MQPPEIDPPPESRFLESRRDRNLRRTSPLSVTLVGASVRSAAQSARRAGYCVIGIDRFGDVDTRQCCDQFATFDELAGFSDEEVGKWSDQNPTTYLLTVGGISGEGSRIIDRLSGTSRLVGPNRDQARLLQDPRWLSETADEAGTGFPTTVSFSSAKPSPAEKFPRHETARNGWLIKSYDALRPSCGGLAVRWVRTDRSSTVTCPSRRYLQQWIPGRCFGASFFSDGRDVCLLGVCRSSFHRIEDLPFVYAGSRGPLRLHARVNDQLDRLGRSIVRRSGLFGLFGVDVIIGRDQKVHLIEINPRWTASSELVERAITRSRPGRAKCSLIGEMLRGTSVDDIRSVVRDSRESEQVYWKRIVFARHDGRFQGVTVPRDFAAANIELADIPAEGRRIRRHEPILSVIIRGDHRFGRGIPEANRTIRRMVGLVSESARAKDLALRCVRTKSQHS